MVNREQEEIQKAIGKKPTKEQLEGVKRLIKTYSTRERITTKEIENDLVQYTPNLSSEQRAGLADVVGDLASDLRSESKGKKPTEIKPRPALAINPQTVVQALSDPSVTERIYEQRKELKTMAMPSPEGQKLVNDIFKQLGILEVRGEKIIPVIKQEKLKEIRDEQLRNLVNVFVGQVAKERKVSPADVRKDVEEHFPDLTEKQHASFTQMIISLANEARERINRAAKFEEQVENLPAPKNITPKAFKPFTTPEALNILKQYKGVRKGLAEKVAEAASETKADTRAEAQKIIASLSNQLTKDAKKAIQGVFTKLKEKAKEQEKKEKPKYIPKEAPTYGHEVQKEEHLPPKSFVEYVGEIAESIKEKIKPREKEPTKKLKRPAKKPRAKPKKKRKKKKGTPGERAKFIKKLKAQGQNTNYILEQLQQEYNINQRQVNAYHVNIERGAYNPPKEKARKKISKPSKKPRARRKGRKPLPRAKNAPEERLPKPPPIIPEEETNAKKRKAKTEIFPKPQKEPAKKIDYDLVLHLFGNLKRKKPEETYEKLEAEVAERFKLNPEEVEKFRKEYADAAKNLFKKIEEAEKAKREKEKIKPVEKQLVDKRAVEAAIDWVNHYREKGLTSEQIKDEIIQKHLELGWTHENAEKIYRLANKNAPRRRPTEKLKAIEQKVVKEPKSWVETYYPTFTSISRGTIRGVDYLAREAIKGADYLAKKTVQPIKKTVSMIRGERERQAKAKQAGIERPIAGWYKKEIKPQLKNLVEREWKEGLPRAKKVAKVGLKGVKGFGEYIVAPAAKAVGKVVKGAGKYILAPAAKLGAKLGVKGIKEGWKLGKAALGDLSDRVEQGYTRLEKKLKEIHPYYIIGALILISAVIFSISKPSTTAFIIFTDNNSFNYKILLGTLLLILAVYMIHNPREEEP